MTLPNVVASFPAPMGNASRAIWNGHEFEIGSARERILAYDVGASGWSDELTALHENAGDGGTHFIDVASRAHAISELKRVLEDRSAEIIEIGCSAGHLLVEMRDALPYAQLTGADYTFGTLLAIVDRCKGIPLIRFDLTKCPLATESYDAAVLLNVLEHIEDHEAAMHHIARILKQGGVAVIEVPAGPELFDDYDRHLMHFRRYRLPELCELAESAGLQIEFKNYLGALMYPAFRLAKIISNRKKRSSAAAQTHVQRSIEGTARFNAIGHAIMAAERQIGRSVTYPAGIRCIVTARKR
jgi:SAM-dependent methyltransferase